MSEAVKANPELGHKATSHAPLHDTEGLGSEANRTQLLANKSGAISSLTAEPSTVMSVGGGSGGGSGTGGGGGGGGGTGGGGGGGSGTGGGPPSDPEYLGRGPPSGPGYNRHGPPSDPGNDRGGPPSDPGYDGRGPPSGPGYDGRGPPSGQVYYGRPPLSRPGYDWQRPPSGWNYNWPYSPSEREYQRGPGPFGPEYDGHHQPPGYVMTHTGMQPRFPTQSTHNSCHLSVPSGGQWSHATPPSQVTFPHLGPSGAPTWGQPLPQPHDITPTHAVGQSGHESSPGYGTQPPPLKSPLLSKPQCPETSSTPSSDNEGEHVCVEDEFRVLVENASSTTQADCIQNFLEAKTELTVEGVLPGARTGSFLVTFKEKPDIGKLKSCFIKRRIEDSWLKVSHVLQATCVKVTSVTPSTTDDSIKFYFMNRRKSGGGEVKNVTRSPDRTGAIVYFHDPEVAKRVCARTHKLNTNDVVVTFHHELLETWDSKGDPSDGASPSSTGARTQQGPGSSTGALRQQGPGSSTGALTQQGPGPSTGARTQQGPGSSTGALTQQGPGSSTGARTQHGPGSSTGAGAQQGPGSSRPSGQGNYRSVKEEPAVSSKSATMVAGKAQPDRPADPPGGTSRSVIIKALDDHLVYFLWTSTLCQKEFVKFVKDTLQGSVRFIPQPKGGTLLSVEHSGSVQELSAWKERVENEISEYVSTCLKLDCLRTSVPECVMDDVHKAVNPILKSNPNLVHMYQGTKNTDLIICGFRGKVHDINVQVSKVKQSAKSISPPRTEHCQLKQFQARYLSFSKFEDKFPKVSIRVDPNTDSVTFEGLSADVLAAKLECLKVVQNLVSETVTFHSEEAAKVLASHETIAFIQDKLNHAHCVWGSRGKHVWIYAETETDAKKGRKIVEMSLTETAIAIDTSTSILLGKAEWREKRDELLEAHPGKLELVHQKGALLIVCTRDIAGHVREVVEQFFSRNALRSKSLPLEPSTAKFLNMFKSNEIRSVEGKLEKYHVKVIVEEGSVCCELRISGYQQGFVEAEKRLDQMISQIFSKTHKICLPGIEEFFVKGKGRELLSAIERNEKCIIEPKDKFPEKKEKKMREMKRWHVPSGGVMSVILGDMRDLAVDAIVNAANKDLQHGGGVAKAIVDKGGRAIVQFCDQYIKDNGQLVDGEAVCSPAGSLPCKVVIHAVGPVWAGGTEGEQEVLKETVGNILKVAESNRIRSIALPAISSGIFGYPLQDAVTAIMEALLNMWQPDPVDYAGPQHVYLCDIKSDTANMFVEIGNKLFGKGGGRHADNEVESSEESLLEEEPVHYSGSDSEDASDTDSTRESTSAADDDGDTPGINVVSRELASLKADVLVNPAQCDLDLSTGAVSFSLLKAAGPQLQEECNQKYEEGINLGEVAVTKGGNLQCKAVFHGLLLKWNNGKGKAEKVLRTLVSECLTEADSRGYKSIAFPALGTGRQGFPADIAADLMFSAVRTFLDTNSASPLQSVYFAAHPSDRAVFKAFKAERDRFYGDTDWMNSTASPHPRATTSRGRGGSSRRGHRTFGRGHVPDASKQESAALAGVFGKLFNMAKGFSSSPTGPSYKFGTVTVVIAQGDVTMETTDCIVNCCKESCDLTYSAVSKAILRAAGPGIQQECLEKRHSMAKYGYILTSGGNLKCKMVAHVRAQHSNYGWAKVLSQCMDWVNRKGMSTMSVPALGTGGLKQSPEKMASAIYEAISKFGATHAAPSLSQVRVVIFQEEMVTSFRTVFAGDRPSHTAHGAVFAGDRPSHTAHGKRGDQGRRRKTTHGRSKPSRHKSPDFDVIDTSNKHIDDSVILCIYADEKKHAEAAKKRITTLCKEEFDHKPLSKSWNEFINKLKDKEVSALYRVADDNGVALSKTAEGLTLTGPVRLVSAAHDIIVEKLQTLQKKFLMQREARTLAQLVQWVYVDEKGRSTPFSPGINCQLEKARNDKVKTLDIEDFKGRKYKVDLEAKLEYPAEGGKPLTIHRMEKGAPSGLGRYVDGEKEALSGSNTVYFPITPERNFKGTAEDLHFRTAESQFYRLLSDHGGRYKVVKVEYVVTPDLVRRFSSAQESLKRSRGEMNAQPILAFHGTDEGNITNICEKGFLMHGDAGFKMKSGNKYGNGVYFSEYPDYSMRYIRGSTKLLLCKVLLGKTFTITSFTQGSVQPGYDSHTSACGKELVIFDTSRILPSYIVHYK